MFFAGHLQMKPPAFYFQDVEVNAACVVTIPVSNAQVHIVEIHAGFLGAAVNQTLTIASAIPAKSYTVVGVAGGGADLIKALLEVAPYPIGANIVVTLPASGVAGVGGYLGVVAVYV
jgi:hypothetical protein